MELRQLRYFVAIAQRRHFTRAAEDLHVAQSALSRQIRALEAELGVQLLSRTSRRVEITQAGEVVLAHAMRVLSELRSLEADLARLDGALLGRLTLGAVVPTKLLDLPALLGEFHSLYPGIDIHLRERAAPELIGLLRRDELDASFTSMAREAIPDGFEHLPLGVDELVVIAATSHPLAELRSTQLQDLSDESFIAFHPNSALRELIDHALRDAGAVPRVAFESNELVTVRALASRGLGVSIVPRSFVETEGPPVAIVEVAPKRLERPITLIWRRDRAKSAASAAFIEFMRFRDLDPEQSSSD